MSYAQLACAHRQIRHLNALQTGFCACAAQECVPTTAAQEMDKKQALIIGDSISEGYMSSLTQALAATHELVHPPGNCGNTNWGSHCLHGWLSDNSSRWDVITFNFGWVRALVPVLLAIMGAGLPLPSIPLTPFATCLRRLHDLVRRTYTPCLLCGLKPCRSEC